MSADTPPLPTGGCEHDQADGGGDTVAGELYIADWRTLTALDAWEEYDPDNTAASPYVRQLVQLRQPRVSAWLYVGCHPPSERIPVADPTDWRACQSG